MRHLAVGGSRRYSAAMFVDALGAGLLRPFLLLYGLRILHLGIGTTGAALSAGLLVGLAALPLVGRWIDRSGGRPAVVATLAVRVAGVGALLLADVLLALGTQSWPTAHAALVAALATGRDRDLALGAGRSLRNAGLGLGALLATLALAGGTDALRLLAGLSGIGYLVAALLVAGIAVPARPAPAGPAVPAGRVGAAFLLLCLLNLPFALLFDVLEVALPAVLLQQLHADPVWPGVVFIGNTVLVVTLSVPLVVRLVRRERRDVYALSGLVLAASYLGFAAAGALGGLAGTLLVVALAAVYTIGEILYTGTATALVIATAPPERLGRTLSRWNLSGGVGMALAPAVLTGLFDRGPLLLWGVLAVATAAAAVSVARFAPTEASVAAAATADPATVPAPAPASVLLI